jgi:tetratricopeptide (TPR) repeat protein
MKESVDALSLLSAAIKIWPNNANLLYLQGAAFHDVCLYNEAIVSLQGAINIRENFPDALNELGSILCKTKNYKHAITYFDACINQSPQFAAAYKNKGNALFEINEFEDAIKNYEKAIEIDIKYAAAYTAKSNALMRMGYVDLAFEVVLLSIEINPGLAHSYNILGLLYLNTCSVEDAITNFDRCINLNPLAYDALWNKSLALLLNGDFDEGFRLYEYRWASSSASSFRPNYSFPVWLGAEVIKNKTILVYGEQGLGDFIQFSRYIKLLVDFGASVVLIIPSEIVGLFNWYDKQVSICIEGDVLPVVDYQCPIMSLPYAFRTKIENIPLCDFRHIIDPSKKIYWKNKLLKNSRIRVGIAWSGSSMHKNDRNRSIGLANFINKLPKCFDYISLQKEIKSTEQNLIFSHNIQHFSEELYDFTDTAALCEMMDVLISVDTSVAHLAASMGKPTWILLPLATDWRWLLDRSDSPWYPSVKLYRQNTFGKWDSVLSSIALDLMETKEL